MRHGPRRDTLFVDFSCSLFVIEKIHGKSSLFYKNCKTTNIYEPCSNTRSAPRLSTPQTTPIRSTPTTNHLRKHQEQHRREQHTKRQTSKLTKATTNNTKHTTASPQPDGRGVRAPTHWVDLGARRVPPHWVDLWARKQQARVGWTVVLSVGWLVGCVDEGCSGSVGLRVRVGNAMVVGCMLEGTVRCVVWGGGVCIVCERWRRSRSRW